MRQPKHCFIFTTVDDNQIYRLAAFDNIDAALETFREECLYYMEREGYETETYVTQFNQAHSTLVRGSKIIQIDVHPLFIYSSSI